jgi:hypothetical protein
VNHDFAIAISFLVVFGPLCFVLCALCFVLCALCFVLCALCFVLCENFGQAVVVSCKFRPS